MREIHAPYPEFGPFGTSAGELPEDVRNRLRQATQQMRTDTTSAYVRATIRELREMAEELGRGPSTSPRWRGNLAAVPA